MPRLRLLYLDGECIDAVRRDPPSIVGDGARTIRELVRDENRLRLEAQHSSMHPLREDGELRAHLRSMGRRLSDVPAPDEVVRVKGAINENAARDNVRILDQVHPTLVAAGRVAAEAIQVRLAGVDFLTVDPTRPLEETGGVVSEVNTSPALHHHLLTVGPALDPGVATLVLDATVGRAPAMTDERPHRTPAGQLPALVVLGGSANALAIARGLAPHGVRVRLSMKRGRPELATRHCHEALAFDASQGAHVFWNELLLGSDARLDGSVLFACDDDAIEFLAQHHAQLAQRYLLDDALPELHQALLDKRRTLQLAESAGVPTPKWWTVRDPQDLSEISAAARFPGARQAAPFAPVSKGVWRRRTQVLPGAGRDSDACRSRTGAGRRPRDDDRREVPGTRQSAR